MSKPYDNEFGPIDLPNPAPCPKCSSKDNYLLSGHENKSSWQMVCEECGHKGPKGLSAIEAILLWGGKAG